MAKATRARRAARGSLADVVFAAHVEQLERLLSRGAGKGLDLLYARAAEELARRLSRYGSADRRVDPSTLRAMRAQVEAVISAMEGGMAKILRDGGKDAVALGIRHAASEFSTLEREFKGTAPVVDVSSGALFSRLVEGADASLLRRHVPRTRTWGASQVLAAEEKMAVGAMTGKPLEELVGELQVELATSRWKAERIVRTEGAYAHGFAKQTAISETGRRLGRPLWKRLVETFDDRTGDDSFLLHGQTVPHDKPFVWRKRKGRGWVLVEFMHPPNRPNDRAVVIPWDPEWDEDEITRPFTRAELSAAQPTRWRSTPGVEIPPGHRPGKAPRARR